nr:prostaglandin reductase 1-like [Leptinotarsa decemlineata]
MVKAKVFIFEHYFDGYPKETDLRLVEEELPPIKEGEFLAEAVFLSVDPYMRAYSVRLPLGIPFIGAQVARIIESKNVDFPVGRYVLGNFDWRSHTICDGKALKGHMFTQDPYILPDFGDLPVSLALGILGMPGNTAYFGVTEVLQPKKGDTVVISGAAGAVGNIAGQICKIIGCTVIGIAGSEEKGRWLVDELGFDYFINYKTQNLEEALKKVAPQGIDCYFDNVGGDVSFTIMNQMNRFGKIAVCGAISGYNEQNPKILPLQYTMVFNELKLQGFHVHRWLNRWMDGILQNLEWIKEGKLKYHETVTDGFENMFKAFLGQMKGETVGKPIVKA